MRMVRHDDARASTKASPPRRSRVEYGLCGMQQRERARLMIVAAAMLVVNGLSGAAQAVALSWIVDGVIDGEMATTTVGAVVGRRHFCRPGESPHGAWSTSPAFSASKPALNSNARRCYVPQPCPGCVAWSGRPTWIRSHWCAPVAPNW